jgi:hypothetical protein
MRLSSLALAAVLLIFPFLLFSTNVMAQHGGGGGGGGSVGGGGGGSHGGGGSSGGSSSSGGGSHSSGGSSSHSSGSSGHSSSAHSSSGHASSSSALHSVAGGATKAAQPEKHGFFSFLRHHKPEPRTVAEIHMPPGCFKGPCVTCPAGHASIGGSCIGTIIPTRTTFCSRSGRCLPHTYYIDDCGALLMLMQQQAARARAAEMARRNACDTGAPECSDLTARSQSEASLSRTLEERYRACEALHGLRTNLAFTGLFPRQSFGFTN